MLCIRQTSYYCMGFIYFRIYRLVINKKRLGNNPFFCNYVYLRRKSIRILCTRITPLPLMTFWFIHSVARKFYIKWNKKQVDLSQDVLQSVSCYCNIQMLTFRIFYLHCNQLEDWNILDILKKLNKLSRLTLHCNPLAAKKCYRPTVIANLPSLRSLDFSLISREENDAATLGITAKFIK